jgi:hypothetical protein
LPDVAEALTMIFNGIRLLGDGITILIQLALAALGLQVPEIAIRIGAVILVILFIWKLGNALSKIWIYALIFLLISLFAGLIPAVGEYLSSILAVVSAHYTFMP